MLERYIKRDVKMPCKRISLSIGAPLGNLDSDMVGHTIRNEVNMLDKAIGISFRRKDQISEEVIWSVSIK